MRVIETEDGRRVAAAEEAHVGWRAASLRAGGPLLVVAVLALEVGHRGWLTDVDDAVSEWFAAHRNIAVDQIALVIMNLVGPVEIASVTVLVATAVGWRFRSLLCGLTVIVTVGGVSLICTLIKLLVVRSRPPVAVQQTLETDYSFPAGHVTGTVALFGVLAMAMGLGRSRLAKCALVAIGLVVVSAVALSCLHLGVHWATDVVAAVLLGGAAVTVGGTVLRTLIEEAPPPPPRFVHPKSTSEALIWTA